MIEKSNKIIEKLEKLTVWKIKSFDIIKLNIKENSMKISESLENIKFAIQLLVWSKENSIVAFDEEKMLSNSNSNLINNQN